MTKARSPQKNGIAIDFADRLSERFQLSGAVTQNDAQRRYWRAVPAVYFLLHFARHLAAARAGSFAGIVIQ